MMVVDDEALMAQEGNSPMPKADIPLAPTVPPKEYPKVTTLREGLDQVLPQGMTHSSGTPTPSSGPPAPTHDPVVATLLVALDIKLMPITSQLTDLSSHLKVVED